LRTAGAGANISRHALTCPLAACQAAKGGAAKGGASKGGLASKVGAAAKGGGATKGKTAVEGGAEIVSCLHLFCAAFVCLNLQTLYYYINDFTGRRTSVPVNKGLLAPSRALYTHVTPKNVLAREKSTQELWGLAWWKGEGEGERKECEKACCCCGATRSPSQSSRALQERGTGQEPVQPEQPEHATDSHLMHTAGEIPDRRNRRETTSREAFPTVFLGNLESIFPVLAAVGVGTRIPLDT
jgi:hypothetical protein